jgi:hypothetical protein
MREMLVTHKHPFHLTYCTNVHAAESWNDTFRKLTEYLPAVKWRVSPEKRFGIGLRLSAVAATELRQTDRLQQFKNWLDENDLYVFTLNGFPYGQFHGTWVKDRVYAPDWREPERLQYTLDLVHILSDLLPDGVNGSISTVPVSYKPWFRDEQSLIVPSLQSAENLAAVALRLWQLEQDTGKLIRLGLEPEPDGLVEDTREFCRYFEQCLAPAIGRAALRHDLRTRSADQAVHRYIGICFDTCHSSVQFESPDKALASLASAGIAVTKVQISSALKIEWQQGIAAQDALASLRELGDPVYLHQVREKKLDGTVHRFTDLPDALMTGAVADAAEWRIHFHVPVFVPAYGALSSTHADTAECIRQCLAHGWCDHFEIETYTWDVLPADLRTDLVQSIAQEFDWTTRQINQ